MRRELAVSVKFLAGAVGIMVALAFVFSAFFIAVEADHDCEGEECHICRTLELCEGILHQSGSAVAVTAAAAATAWVVCAVSIPVAAYVPGATLVTDKVKMND